MTEAKKGTLSLSDHQKPLSKPDRDEPHSDSRGDESKVYSARDWEVANAPTDPDRRRRTRERWGQQYLPDLPKKPGMHRMWASTSHTQDTIARRLAIGYRILSLDELMTEGWRPEQYSVKDTASANGEVRWREMIAMEIPEEDYQDYMREFHHDQPLDNVRDIYAPLQETQQRIRDAGGRLEFGEGIQEMLRHRRPDRQFE